MMSKQPEARFQTAAEVALMLGKWLESRGKEGLSGSGIGSARRPVGPPPRRSASRSGGLPILPPRRSEKPADDTLSNMDRDTTINGGSASGPPSKLAHPQPNQDSRILGQPGHSSAGRSGAHRAVRGGSSILGFGDSSVLGKPSVSGKNLDRGSSKSLPIAKSLDIRKTSDASKPGGVSQPSESPKPAANDDTLSKLIDQAVEQAKATAAKSAQPASAIQPLRQLSAESPVPAWIWFSLGGGLLLVVGVIVLVLLLVRL
jgi:hypothetical protein